MNPDRIMLVICMMLIACISMYAWMTTTHTSDVTCLRLSKNFLGNTICSQEVYVQRSSLEEARAQVRAALSKREKVHFHVARPVGHTGPWIVGSLNEDRVILVVNDEEYDLASEEFLN